MYDPLLRDVTSSRWHVNAGCEIFLGFPAHSNRSQGRTAVASPASLSQHHKYKEHQYAEDKAKHKYPVGITQEHVFPG